MFNMNDLVANAIRKLGREEEITPFEKAMIDEAKTQAKRMEKRRKKFAECYKHIATIDTGHVKTVEGKQVKIQVPMFRYMGWDFGKKYTGLKLANMRRQIAKQAVKDGLPAGVRKEDLVDLWKHNDKQPETITRQQFRAMQRAVAKKERSEEKKLKLMKGK